MVKYHLLKKMEKGEYRKVQITKSQQISHSENQTQWIDQYKKSVVETKRLGISKVKINFFEYSQEYTQSIKTKYIFRDMWRQQKYKISERKNG